jgi:2-polyprenyl-6-hydroxyphenyl methylase/3-demethylubiquinone-9 3-methyltransferase
MRPRPRSKNDLTIYDTFAADWWTGRVRFMRNLRALVEVRMRFFDKVVPRWKGAHVLDVGCGGGLMSLAMAQRAAHVVGVDPSVESLEAGRREAARAGLAVEFRPGVGESLPVDRASMDIVLCVDVLEHVTDLARVVRECGRVLKPGGLLLFDTINRGRLATFLVVHVTEGLLRMAPRGTHDPAMFVTPAELAEHLDAAGFSTPVMQGLMPLWLRRDLSPVFVLVPFLHVMYLGHATLDRQP